MASVEERKKTLSKILYQFDLFDRRPPKKENQETEEEQGEDPEVDFDDLPDDFDPEVAVGELKGKVDAIKWMLNKWEADAKELSTWVEPYQKRIQTLLKKQDRLKKYVHREMVKHNFKKLPGDFAQFALKRTKPVVEVSANANAELYLKYEDLMRSKVTYEWDKPTLLKKLKAGEEVPFATLRENYSLDTNGVKIGAK